MSRVELIEKAHEILGEELRSGALTPHRLHEARRLLNSAMGLIPGKSGEGEGDEGI